MPQRPSLYITWHYTINTTQETAQVGLHLATASGPSDPVDWLENETTTGVLQAFDTAMSKLMAVSALSWNENVRYTGLKVAALGTDGQYLADPKVFTRTTPLMATSTNANILLQASVVLSWRTGVSIGAGNRGRMYLPATGPNSWSSGSVHMPPGLVTSMAAGGAELIKDCNAAYNALGASRPVASIVYAQPPTAGPYFNAHAISHCWVGDMVDTQRRRREQIQETYSVAAVP